jgi:hypothetical protein
MTQILALEVDSATANGECYLVAGIKIVKYDSILNNLRHLRINKSGYSRDIE